MFLVSNFSCLKFWHDFWTVWPEFLDLSYFQDFEKIEKLSAVHYRLPGLVTEYSFIPVTYFITQIYVVLHKKSVHGITRRTKGNHSHKSRISAWFWGEIWPGIRRRWDVVILFQFWFHDRNLLRLIRDIFACKNV